MVSNISELMKQLEDELISNILPFWRKVAPDPDKGGFHGFINNENIPAAGAPKGLVMHARLLWAFSAVRRYFGEHHETAEEGAHRAEAFINRRLADPVHGGFWWQTDAAGNPTDRHKVVYGQAFALYAFSEALRLKEDRKTRREAGRLFELLENHARDRGRGGYLEILNEDWSPDAEGRLSDADIPCHRSMNTNLHIIEAYTNYFRVRPEPEVAEALESAVRWFCRDIFDPTTGHLRLFLDAEGRSMEDLDSYGHDIEASWLLHEAAETVGGNLAGEIRPVVLSLAESARRDGVTGSDGAMDYERHGQIRVTDRIWWVQAEAMVGSWNLYTITGDTRWKDDALGYWNYIRRVLIDREHGEWFWGADTSGTPLTGKEKAGLWKTPYHNARSCLEMLDRLKTNEEGKL